MGLQTVNNIELMLENGAEITGFRNTTVRCWSEYHSTDCGEQLVPVEIFLQRVGFAFCGSWNRYQISWESTIELQVQIWLPRDCPVMCHFKECSISTDCL